jgi:formate hydrogenlyase regulatory protein HycA
MAMPDKIRISLDEYHFENVGRLPDGTQFMAYVTGAFPTGMKYYSGDDWRTRKKWLAVIHRFDRDGNHIGTEAQLGAFDTEGRRVAGDKAFDRLQAMYAALAASGEPEFCDIRVRLFSVEIDGVTHGLFYEQSEEEPAEGEERGEWVMLEPRDIMFHPPWDSGEYST